MVIPKALLAAGEGIDRLFLRALVRTGRPKRRVTRENFLGYLEDAGAFYTQAARDGRLFPAPDAAQPRERKVRRLDGGSVVDLTWPSGWSRLHPRAAEVFDQVPQNRICRARWFRHHEPAPVFVALHGFGAGNFLFEERAYQASWLYSKGLDVVLTTLPMHAKRGPAMTLRPLFPSPDPIVTNDGFAQAAHDVRALITLLRKRGVPVGLSGMSLGGLTTSLLATLIDLDWVIPIVPVSSVAKFMWAMGEGSDVRQRAIEKGLTYELFATSFVPTAPLERKPLVDAERVLLIAGERDRVVPIHHAELLREHFGARDVVTFAGAHIVQLGRGAIFRSVLSFLRERGVV
jgi:hypothetical protein